MRARARSHHLEGLQGPTQATSSTALAVSQSCAFCPVISLTFENASLPHFCSQTPSKGGCFAGKLRGGGPGDYQGPSLCLFPSRRVACSPSPW